MRKRILIYSILAFVGAVLIAANPVNRMVLKVGFLVGLAISWSGFLYFSWKTKAARYAVLSIPVVILLFLILPGRDIDIPKLRKDYVQRVKAFEGTEYYWGGENSRGIDCSGLPRRALQDALLSYGIRHLNGRPIRAALEQWWFDASAKALSEGYREYTTPVGVKGSVAEMNYEGLTEGDMAVTFNGVHVLVYLEGNQWIQAEPGIKKVITLDGKKDENTWFGIETNVYRWKILEP